MTIPPSHTTSATPRMLYLKHYIRESSGWDNDTQCSTCHIDCRETMRPFSTCTAPASYYCNICRRQPLSLLVSAAHIVFNYVFNIEQFDLTMDTTHQQYQYAVSSSRVSNWRLLPPEYPILQVMFRFHCCILHRHWNIFR